LRRHAAAHEAQGERSGSDEGLALINNSIRRVEDSGDDVYMPELLRVKAAILLAQSQHNRDEAEGHLVQSLELSRRHGARAWELRTATDLAALWAGLGRAADARALLSPVLKQFTEGSDTVDLKAAERLLRTPRKA
jgi:predicted ATPase